MSTDKYTKDKKPKYENPSLLALKREQFKSILFGSLATLAGIGTLVLGYHIHTHPQQFLNGIDMIKSIFGL